MSEMVNTHWFCFTAEQGATAQSLCEAVMPGSAPAGPAVYLDSVAVDMPTPLRDLLLGFLDAASEALAEGKTWKELAQEPYFGFLRAQAIEAYYSDFRQPGYTGPGAWDAVGFRSAPLAARAKQDWSFLRCHGGPA